MAADGSSTPGTAPVSRTGHGPAAARLAAAGSSTPTPSFDPAVYNACQHPTGVEPPEPFDATVAGWSDASKLGEATVVGDPVPAAVQNTEPGEGFQFGSVIVDGSTYQCYLATAQLDYDGQREFPPVQATFLAFGFMPVTATAYLIQSGPQPLSAVAWADFSPEIGGTAVGSYAGINDAGVVTSRVVLRLADITVNGVPLDVGAHCQTAGPLYSPPGPADPDPAADPLLVMAGGDVAADGDPHPYWGTQDGGALAGEATIPPFTGCITPAGENLNPLLDASISGPGNYLRIQQGPGCIGGTLYCVNGAIQPLPGALWTVKDGGPYTATGPVTLTMPAGFSQVTISCPNSTISGTIPDAAGPPRGPQDTPAQISFGGDCTGTKGTASDGTWTITEEGTEQPDFYAYNPANGTVLETLWGVTLDLTGTGVPGTTAPCTMQMTGHLDGYYADTTAQLSTAALPPSEPITPSLQIASTTCPVPPRDGAHASLTFTYQFNRHVQITSP